MTNVITPDVSFYQDDPATPLGVNFDVMRLNGAAGVIIRAGQNSWVDRYFAKNWSAARQAELPRGSYWFYDSRAKPKDQAELFALQVKNDPPELPLFADFEDNYNGSYKGWNHWYVFLEHMKSLTEAEIAIYTAYYYWVENTMSLGIPIAALNYFKQYPLWIANYGVDKPLVPKPWAESDWLFWQYTSKGDGKPYGVESKNIDLNYFNGDLEAFNKRFGLSDTPSNPTKPVISLLVTTNDGQSPEHGHIRFERGD